MLDDFKDGIQLVIYINQSDLIDKKPAADRVITSAMQHGFMGASLFRAVEGYGSSHVVERAHLLSLEDQRGEMIVLIDGESARVEEFLNWLKGKLPGTFVTASSIRHIRLS